MEKQRDTILEYFPPGDVMEKDYNYYVFKSGWIYIKRKTSALSLFGGGRTAHILKIKGFTLILLSEEGPEKIAEWIKSKKEIPRKDPEKELTRVFGTGTKKIRPEIYYDGDRVIRMAQRLVYGCHKYEIRAVAGYENGKLFWKLKVYRNDESVMWVNLKGEPTTKDIEYHILKEEIL